MMMPAWIALAAVVLAAVVSLGVQGAAGSAADESAVTLNEAADRDLITIVQARSTGGYSRFMIELENRTDKPLVVDPYGSAFDPPSGTRTQRVGIGLPIRIGNERVDIRKALSTDPSQEAPVGPGSAAAGQTIPDAALPAAAGAAAGAAAVGTLLTGMAQGVRPREALSELAGLMRGESDLFSAPEPPGDAPAYNPQVEMLKAYRDQDMTDLDFQRQRLEAARAQGAADVVRDAEEQIKRLDGLVRTYDRNLAELGEKPLEHAQGEKRTFDFQRRDLNAEVRAELAAQAAGTITDTDRIGMKLWIIDNAPTEQSAQDMQKLIDAMTTTTKDGATIGDKASIYKALSGELQRTNQPRLTYFEQYALREGDDDEHLLETLDKMRKDGMELSDSLKELTQKKVKEAEEKLTGFEPKGIGETASKASDLIEAAETIYGDTKKYMDGGNSGGLAFTRAVTQYGVDFGVNKLMEQHPVMKVINNTLKFAEPVIGKDITPARGWKVLVDKAFDSYTGEFDHKAADRIDFGSDAVKGRVLEAQAKAIEQRLKNPALGVSERADLTARLAELRKQR